MNVLTDVVLLTSIIHYPPLLLKAPGLVLLFAFGFLRPFV